MAPANNMVNPESKVSEAHQRKRVNLARLEADLAYFQARLEMIGQPGSTNQLAQHKVFMLLSESTGAKVAEAEQAVSEMF
ncbi:hypothetical protein [uncultured Thiodictyon sp.]|uniref:hypothetical protein n=1 Tax=uncultured Thiodictyon sp. TaxID=1846217 RepID=UPI0025CDC8FB|nr:hypothetical protein [uncultured Thiodictyon sp.]